MKNPIQTIEDFEVNIYEAENGNPEGVTVRNLRDALLAISRDGIGIGTTAAKVAEMAAAFITEFGDPETALEVDASIRITGRPLSPAHHSHRSNADFGGWSIHSKNCRMNCGFEAAPDQNGLCYACAGV